MGEIDAAISGGGSVLSSLISGLFGSAAQRRANETNLAIARETNAANERINQANIDYSWKALQEQQRYASFGNQIEMAKAAGVNPYLAIGNPVTGGSAITPVSHAMQATRVEPENAFASALGRASQDAATMVSLLSQARKADAETQGIRTDNLYRAAQQEADLNLKGLQGAAQQLKNTFDEQNNPLLLRAQELNNEYLTQQIGLAQIESDIKTYYRDKIQPQELNKILEQIKLWKEQGRTEISQQELNRALGRAHLTQASAQMIQARVQQFLAPSQKQLNISMASNQQAQAELNGVAKELKQNEVDVAEKYAMALADADLRNKLITGKMNRQQMWKYYNENRLLEKGIKWFEFEKFCEHPLLYSSFGPMFGVE